MFNEAAYLILGEYKIAFCPDETRKAEDSMHDFRWHRGLERAGTNECHDIVYMLNLKAEEVPYRFDMHVILDDWVLKSSLKPVNHLRPLCLVRLTEYPPFYVLGFNHEYSIRRNDQVVNLGGFVSDWQRNVLDKAIDFPIEEERNADVDLEFAQLSLEPRRPQNQGQNQNWQNEQKPIPIRNHNQARAVCVCLDVTLFI